MEDQPKDIDIVIEDSNHQSRNSIQSAEKCENCHASIQVFTCKECKKKKCSNCFGTLQENKELQDLVIQICKECSKSTSEKLKTLVEDLNENKFLIGRKKMKNEDSLDSMEYEDLSMKDGVDKIRRSIQLGNDATISFLAKTKPKEDKKPEKMKSENTVNRQFINCHKCKKIDNSVNMVICSNIDCRESFCYNCIKKAHKNAETFQKFKSQDDKSKWNCLKCTNECTCKQCQSFNNDINEDQQEQMETKKIGQNTKRFFAEINKNDEFRHIEKNRFFVDPEPQKKIFETKPKVISNELINPCNDSPTMSEDENMNNNLMKFTVLEDNKKEYDHQDFIQNKMSQAISKVEVYSHKKSKQLYKSCVICLNNEVPTNEILKFRFYEDFIYYVKFNLEQMHYLFNNLSSEFQSNKKEFQLIYHQFIKNSLTQSNKDCSCYVCKKCFQSKMNSEKGLESMNKLFINNGFLFGKQNLQSNINSSDLSNQKNVPPRIFNNAVTEKNNLIANEKQINIEKPVNNGGNLTFNDKFNEMVNTKNNQSSTTTQMTNDIRKNNINFNPPFDNLKESLDEKNKIKTPNFIKSIENISFNKSEDVRFIEFKNKNEKNPPVDNKLNINNQHLNNALNSQIQSNAQKIFTSPIVNNKPTNIPQNSQNILQNQNSQKNFNIHDNIQINSQNSIQNQHLNTPKNINQNNLFNSNNPIPQVKNVNQNTPQYNIQKDKSPILTPPVNKNLNNISQVNSQIPITINKSPIQPSKQQTTPIIIKPQEPVFIDKPTNNNNFQNQNQNQFNHIKDNGSKKENSESKTSEELKKMLSSIQNYTGTQKNFIMTVFENLDIFMDQINQNQIMNEMIVNSLAKLVPKFNPSMPSQEDVNTIYEQIKLLKKVSTIGLSITSLLNNNFSEMKNTGLHNPYYIDVSKYEEINKIQKNENNHINSLSLPLSLEKKSDNFDRDFNLNMKKANIIQQNHFTDFSQERNYEVDNGINNFNYQQINNMNIQNKKQGNLISNNNSQEKQNELKIVFGGKNAPTFLNNNLQDKQNIKSSRDQKNILIEPNIGKLNPLGSSAKTFKSLNEIKIVSDGQLEFNSSKNETKG